MVSSLVAAAPRQVRAVRGSFFFVRSPLLWLCSCFVASLVYSSLRNQGHAAAGMLPSCLIDSRLIRRHLSCSVNFLGFISVLFLKASPVWLEARKHGARQVDYQILRDVCCIR